MADLKIQHKKDWAKLLFLRENISQKEIAAKVQVTEKTIGNWIKKEDWDRLKASVIITKEEELKRIYMQINEINSSIESRAEGKRFADNREADILSKLSAIAKNLETNVSLSETIEVFKRFLNWLRPVDLEKAKEFINYQDNYIKSILR